MSSYFDYPRSHPQEAEPAQAATNPDPVEDETMLRRWLGKVADKVLEASTLRDEVQKLQATIETMQAQIQGLQQQISDERAARREVEAKLADTQHQLDHEQRAVHDLVAERDQERDQKVEALSRLRQANQDLEFWQQEAARLERERNEVQHLADVCREGREQMAGQIMALKNAFQGLQVIGTS